MKFYLFCLSVHFPHKHFTITANTDKLKPQDSLFMKLDRIKYNISRDFRIPSEFKKKMGEFLSNFEKKNTLPLYQSYQIFVLFER